MTDQRNTEDDLWAAHVCRVRWAADPPGEKPLRYLVRGPCPTQDGSVGIDSFAPAAAMPFVVGDARGFRDDRAEPSMFVRCAVCGASGRLGLPLAPPDGTT